MPCGSAIPVFGPRTDLIGASNFFASRLNTTYMFGVCTESAITSRFGANAMPHDWCGTYSSRFGVTLPRAS